MPSIRRIIASCIVALTFCSGLAAQAQDFRVDNKLILPGQKPIESATLFAADMAYDFLDASQETIVFDKTNNLITILDLATKTKTEVGTGEISTEIGRLHEAARGSKQEFVRMSAAPQFAQRVDSKTGQLTMDNKWIQYVVSAEAPKNPFSARQYNEFADWLAQVNALLNPPNLPFARLKLNEALKQRQEIPVEIELTKRGAGRNQPIVARSEHRIQWTLSPADKARLDETARQMQTFATVPFQRFRPMPDNAEARR